MTTEVTNQFALFARQRGIALKRLLQPEEQATE